MMISSTLFSHQLALPLEMLAGPPVPVREAAQVAFAAVLLRGVPLTPGEARKREKGEMQDGIRGR